MLFWKYNRSVDLSCLYDSYDSDSNRVFKSSSKIKPQRQHRLSSGPSLAVKVKKERSSDKIDRYCSQMAFRIDIVL